MIIFVTTSISIKYKSELFIKYLQYLYNKIRFKYMSGQFQKSGLVAFDKIIKKVKSWLPNKDKQFQLKIINVLQDLQFVRNDIQLISNRNINMKIKMKEQQERIDQLILRCQLKDEETELKISMIKHKYEKSMEEQKFLRFMNGHERVEEKRKRKNGRHGQERKVNENQIDLLQQQSNTKNIRISDQYETVKKQLIIKTVNQKTMDMATHKQVVNEFDLDVRLKQKKDIMSEPFTYLSKKRQIVALGSQYDAQNSEICKSKKKRQKSSSRYVKTQLLAKKKKSQQLAQLVAQQSKVPHLRQKYFSTDRL